MRWNPSFALKSGVHAAVVGSTPARARVRSGAEGSGPAKGAHDAPIVLDWATWPRPAARWVPSS